ncbi:Chanoclavine-I dehydrogenase [Cladophialophora carrionii]|uniref:Chanoclavine-I dehydrogenase n=1 Tax=Cladophialophora carrionii TaxID=86049 RepID=A0A1C1CJ28_9EURO|nr:Chanoclavine-I dehydrogenase [Cladophialophora carrionii]
MAQLQDKVIAITGAASGIGAATARLAAARGASGLALSDINEQALTKVVDELKAKGTKVTGTRLDVSDSAQVDAWIAATVKEFGRLDGAANIAGVEGPPGGKVFQNLVDISNEHWDYIMRINLTGVFYCLRAQLRVMERGASVLNVASLAGVMGRPGIGAYSTSKHGVVGLSRTAAKEVGERGIRVNALAPLLNDGDATDRPVTNTYKTLPLQRLGTADDMAKTICFVLSDDSSYTTGATFSADGGVAC